MAHRLYEFGDKIADKLKADDVAKKVARERSGKISGGKLGSPTLWAVLDIIGVPKEHDPYLLGKFMRGNDVEARAIEFLTSIPISDQVDGEWIEAPETSILGGKVMLQAPGSYRGGTGYIDIEQKVHDLCIKHEIKSSTKMAYDKIAASGRSKGKEGEPGYNAMEFDGVTGQPYTHHTIQLIYYALDEQNPSDKSFLHYLNADDYRMCSFEVTPDDYVGQSSVTYKELIDIQVDSIQLAFASKQLPSFVPFLGWHKAYKKGTYGDWNDLSPDQMMRKLETQFPDCYEKFMETEL